MPAPDRTYTAEEVDAAVAVLSAPDRLRHAEAVVTHAAPALQRVLAAALQEGGYVSASAAQVAEASRLEDAEQRVTALRSMVAEEARLGMLVGAAVGFQLARELERMGGSAEGIGAGTDAAAGGTGTTDAGTGAP